jgi:hypothetical protein
MHPTYQNGDDAVIKNLHRGTWDARMYQNTLDHLNVLNQVDAELYNFLSLNGYDGSEWAVRNVVNPSNSPQLDAINTFNSSTPLAITVGSVPPFSRAGNAFDNRSDEKRNVNGTGSTTLSAIADGWVTSHSSSYLFRVNSTGTYNVQIQYSTSAAATLAVEFAGNVVGTFNLANTNGASSTTAYININCNTDKLYSIRPICTSGSVKIEYVNVGGGIKSATSNINGLTINEISIYPNPATEYVNIDLTNFSDELTNISMVDLNGRIVYKKAVSQVTNLSIATDNFEQGIYLITVSNGTKCINKKIVIQ